MLIKENNVEKETTKKKGMFVYFTFYVYLPVLSSVPVYFWMKRSSFTKVVVVRLDIFFDKRD